MKYATIPILLVGFFSLLNCASSEYLSAFSSIQADSLKQINDEDIRKAFEANPQITIPATIAIYNASRDKYPFRDSIVVLKAVDRVIEISPSLLSPEPYFESQYDPNWPYLNRTPKPINLKQLRLYAAQAKTDLVLFVSTSTSFEQDVNILSPLYLGLVTIPFVPGKHVKLTTYLEAYVIDVRNGLLYSSYRDKRRLKKKYVRVSFVNKVDHHKNIQIDDMLPDLISYIEETLDNPAFRLSLN